MIKIEAVFKSLNDELKKAGLELTIICVGGFVLEHRGLRATKDIDAFYNESEQIKKIIHQIGEKFNINSENEPWLNNSVSSMNMTPPLKLCDSIYKFDNLHVFAAPITYVLGMKMISARTQDLKDIGAIIKHKKLLSPFDTFEELKKMGFNCLDFSLMLEGFSYAYGIDWLEEFFKNNQAQIKKYY